MLTLTLAQLGAFILLIGLSALFSSSENAFFSLDPLQIRRMEADHPTAARKIERFLSEPTHLLSTILIGNTLVNVFASALGFTLAEQLFPSHGEAIAVPAVTLVLLIFGEIGPKRIAMFWPEKVSLFFVQILPVAVRVFTPLQVLMNAITRHLEHHFQEAGRTLTEEELETVVSLSGEEGVIEELESNMVKSIMGLEDFKASDLMVPRVDIVGIDLNDPPEDCVHTALHAGVRFIPLYTDDLDQIQALLDVSEYLLDPDHVLAAARITPFFVPELATLDSVLEQFQTSNHRVAVVVDEYGGTAGLITRGDILSKITGDIADDFKARKPQLTELGPNRWMADGNVSLEDLNERTGLELSAEGDDRLAGWMAMQSEQLPEVGTVVEAQGCRAVVREKRRHRITAVFVERQEGEAT